MSAFFVRESIELPPDLIEWIRSVFGACNSRVTEKLCMNPNVAEEWLDFAWIDHLSGYSSPVALPSGWTARIDAHFLGKLRHYEERWEIADIGILVFVRFPDGTWGRKVALLQSKRLYPDNQQVRVETLTDYEIGFARLADPEDEVFSIAFDEEFRFTEDSKYGALERDSAQERHIIEYQERSGLHVYYQLYNPWAIPFTQRIPLAESGNLDGSPDVGIRVVPATAVRTVLDGIDTRNPAFVNFADVSPLPAFGWRLEQFICDEVLACREGDEFPSVDDGRIQTLFYRRSGPISAAIRIFAEAPSEDE